MQEQFCTYEISLKLKELGFNEECLGYYHVNEGYTKGYAFCYSENTRTSDCSVLAPLWQQVIDWLRERYNLCIEIQCPQREFDFYSWTIHEPLGINDEEYNCKTYEDGFTNNYYKCREQAILKAIELCQKKK